MTAGMQTDGLPAGMLRRVGLSGGLRGSAARNGFRVVLLALALAGLAAGGMEVRQWWTVGRFTQYTDNAYLRADAIVVAPKVAGYVTHVLVAANQEVSAGQALVQIDRGHFEAAVAAAAANVAGRRADLARTRAEIARQQAVVAQAAAQVMLERRAAAFAAGEAQRSQALAQAGAGTTQNRDATEATSDEARAGAAAAEAGLAMARLQAGLLAAQIDQNAAALDAAQAAARDAGIDLDATTITANEAGRIGDKAVTDGQYVQAGTRLMSIMPMDDIYLEANFKETQVGAMQPGQKVAIRIDALPGVTLAGRVESLSPGTGAEFALFPADNATGNFTKIVQRVPVRIRLMSAPSLLARLIAGLSAEASVDTRATP